MWKRLLVPHDFSACAARALDVALELARQTQGEVVILHVSPLPPNLARDARVTPPGASAPVRIDELTTAGARRALDALAAGLASRGCTVRTLATVTEGEGASEGILRAADELGADAIVLGTHGRKGLAHLLLGSIAEKVIRSARVPVVTVRTAGAAGAPTREEALAEDELSG